VLTFVLQLSMRNLFLRLLFVLLLLHSKMWYLYGECLLNYLTNGFGLDQVFFGLVNLS